MDDIFATSRAQIHGAALIRLRDLPDLDCPPLRCFALFSSVIPQNSKYTVQNVSGKM